MTDFYLYLPSNTPGFPNTASSFQIQIPNPIELHGQYEIALIDAVYPHTWFNISDADTTIKIYYYSKTIGDWKRVYTGNIHANNYKSIEQLVAALNQELINFAKELEMPAGDPKMKFAIDPLISRVVFKMDTATQPSLLLTKKIQYMLGFSHNFLQGGTVFEGDYKVVIAENAPDKRGGLSQLYVYCNLCEPVTVGNVMANLLAYIPVTGEYPDVQHFQVLNPAYSPLLNKRFDIIKIEIKDDQNRLINFAFGKVILKIRIKKKSLVL